MLAAAVAFTAFIYCNNSLIESSAYTHTSPQIPQGFDGLRILHISDLHSKSFGKKNSRLLSLIKRQEADIIIVTGDVVDSYCPDLDASLDFLEKVEAVGITVLDNKSAALEKDGAKIMLCRISGKRANGYYSSYDEETADKLKDNMRGCFSILLSHYPEDPAYYSALGCDVVFYGHAHGGQFRIPFTNIGIFAPNQGFFPKYVGGKYEYGETVMYVSRGLGNSIFPMRVFNRPHLVTVTLEKEE